MSTFIQLHLLTSYPPANLNRDDLGRPKTAVMGGAQRLRISSQSLKRAWRTSEPFRVALDGRIGTRTKRISTLNVLAKLIEAGVPEKEANAWAGAVSDVFGKRQKDQTDIEQLAHLSPAEVSAVDALAQTIIKDRRAPKPEELDGLLKADTGAADIALFGRMLAAKPSFNVEAAAQVAHAITVHKVAVEDDYFTAVDDLNRHEEDAGAGHIGETEFAAGLFYLYVCIDRDLLEENLQHDSSATAITLRALAEAALTVGPTGKQNSFASRAWASYALAEKGSRQPRSLSVAFLKPVTGEDLLDGAVAAIERTRANMEKVYGPQSDSSCAFNTVTGEGDYEAFLGFVSSASAVGKHTK